MENKTTEKVTITIKPYYRGETLNYIVGIIENLDMHVISATDTQGFIMGVPGKTSAENPANAVFAITKEEFAFKDTDREKLDNLALELMRELPQDRIIAETNLRQNDRAETIDGGKCASERSEQLEKKKNELNAASLKKGSEFVSKIMKAGEAWYIFTRGLNPAIPTIDVSGAIQLFSSEERANAFVASVKDVPLAVTKVDKNGLGAVINNLFRFGITRVKGDIMTPDSCEFERDDIFHMGELKGFDIANSRLLSLMIRYMQIKQIKDNKTAQASVLTLWDAICKEFPRGIYFVPMMLEGETATEITEKKVHFSAAGAKAFGEQKPKMLGMDGYSSAAPDGKGMRFALLKNNSDKEQRSFLPVFTDIIELNAVFKGKARPCIIAYDDIKDNYKSCDGVVINPASLNLIISPVGLENIEKEKDGKLKVFKVEE